MIRFRMQALDVPAMDALPNGWTFRVPLPIPAARAFDLLASADAWPRWYPDIRSARWLDAPGLDARREVVTTVATLQERFVVWEPGRAMGFTVDWMTLPLTSAFCERFELEPDGAGSVLHWRVGYQARLPFRPLRFALDPIFRRMFDQGVARLPAFAATWSA